MRIYTKNQGIELTPEDDVNSHDIFWSNFQLKPGLFDVLMYTKLRWNEVSYLGKLFEFHDSQTGESFAIANINPINGNVRYWVTQRSGGADLQVILYFCSRDGKIPNYVPPNKEKQVS